jgi:hypothetical protein
MLRWRKDKPAAEADRLETLRASIPDAPAAPGKGSSASDFELVE